MCARIKEPFEYKNVSEFKTKLVDWIGDILYDFLPEHGYEVRDEQIYTAFQIADAMCDRKIHLAEAGLGTGKTIAYLLSAIPYARLHGKPVVIACATSALQEQLASEGDIYTLSRLLGLQVDARMAKDSRNYICDVKVEELQEEGTLSEELSAWIKQTKLGERSEIPTISDRDWKKIAWDESMGCDKCINRGYCKLVKARQYYREATDLLIVDHETFFFDLWTRQERLADGKLPILPNYCAVIFDEGHKIMLPATLQAGNQISKEEMEDMINAFEEIQGARNSLATVTMQLAQANNAFFNELYQSIVEDISSVRKSIRISNQLLKTALTFRKVLEQILLEMQIEQELYIGSIPTSLMQAYEGQVERAIMALSRFCNNSETICWVDQGDKSFWVVPRNIHDMLDKQLYHKNIPTIFTSATLSNDGNFEYFNRMIGVRNPSKSTVGSPFDLEEQITITIPKLENNENNQFEQKLELIAELLVKNGGRALVLTNSLVEVKKIRKKLSAKRFDFDILWEDLGDRGYLARKFREEETTVLIGANYWEGIDVPGDSLNLLIIWELPFPTLDPLIEVQRKEANELGLDSMTTVDYPEMGLKLKQGCGRLIRTEEDKGRIVILASVQNTPWEKNVMGALPIQILV